MKIDFQRLEIGEWVIRFREPEDHGPHPVVWLFHGWQGDEDSMEVFIPRIPAHYLILAPRGLHQATSEGFGWYPSRVKGWPAINDFRPAVYGLLDLMDNWPMAAPWGDFERVRLAGFSQGAALAYTFAWLFPQKIISLAGLAGFLPRGLDPAPSGTELQKVPVYISHGENDSIVPVQRAREAASFFERAGAVVTLCESDVGHKLSADCFKKLEVFFE